MPALAIALATPRYDFVSLLAQMKKAYVAFFLSIIYESVTDEWIYLCLSIIELHLIMIHSRYPTSTTAT
jgi:hypothetical protein